MRSCAYTRPKDSIHHKFKPDVPQNPLSNYAFQQIARIPNRIKKWSPNGSKKWSRIPLSSSLYYMSYIYLGPLFGCKGVSAHARIPNGSKPWSRRLDVYTRCGPGGGSRTEASDGLEDRFRDRCHTCTIFTSTLFLL